MLCRERAPGAWRLRPALLALGIAFAAISPSARAVQYEVQGALDQQLQYNDNLILSRQDPQAAFGYILSPSLQAAARTPLLELSLNGLGSIRRYDDSQFDCDTFIVGGGARYQMKSSNLGFAGSYNQNCTYNLQLGENTALNPQSRSDSYRLGPIWSWDWARNHRLVAEGQYSNSAYTALTAGGNGTGLFNSEIYTARLTENYTWSPDLTVLGGLNFSRNKYSGLNASTQDIYGIQLGANYSISPQWAFSVGGGPRWVDTRANSDDPLVLRGSGVALGYTDNISLTYSGQNSGASIGYSDSLVPSALGQTVQLRSVFLQLRHDVTRRIALSLNTSYSSSQSVQESEGNARRLDSSYLTATAGVAWRMAEDWTLGGSYIYRWQDVVRADAAALLNTGTTDSNTVMLFLNYQWPGLRNSW